MYPKEKQKYKYIFVIYLAILLSSMNKSTKPKSKQSLRAILIVLGIVGLLLIGYGLYWAYNNTAFLRGNIASEDLSRNNLNPPETLNLLPQEVNGKTLFIPAGFKISVYATDIKNARFFSFSPSGVMYIGTKNGDSIYAIKGSSDALADKKLVDSGLNTPHSVYYHEGDLYLAEQNRVSVYRGITDEGTFEKKEVLVDGLPSGNTLTGGGHTTRTIIIGPDKKIYLSIGSSCNVCIEEDNRRATVMRFNLDGSGGEIFASGLRNTVGMAFEDNKLWGLDMGRDQIGDDIPPEEVNVIEQGKDYGWPYCYGNRINNPEFKDKVQYCQDSTIPPVLELQAHDAPLGISFMNQRAKETWPSFYSQGFFAAMHGSWNRTVPTGYKIIWVDTKSTPMKSYNFLTGWLEAQGAWGRPVGVGFSPEGNLFISDDKQNLVYLVSYIQ